MSGKKEKKARHLRSSSSRAGDLVEQNSGVMADSGQEWRVTAEAQRTGEPTHTNEELTAKLDYLTTQVQRLSTLPDMLKSLEEKLLKENEDIKAGFKAVEDETINTAKTVSDTATIVSGLQRELKVERAKTTTLQRELNYAKQHILHLETYSRKHNIVIEGMPEVPGETRVMDQVQKFFYEQLNLDIKPSDIDKAHRYGRVFNNKPRPILVRFMGIASRDLVLQNVKKLREARSPIYVNEDLPPEVKRQRADMRAIATYARHLNESAVVKGDTLTLNQSKYKSMVAMFLPL